MFVPSSNDFYFLAFDLSQAESWVVAHLANEQSMMNALEFDDIHIVTAAAMFDLDRNGLPDDEFKKKYKTQRYVGKKCNHSFAYRMGENRFCTDFNKESFDLGISISLKQAKDYRKKWHNLYNLQTWWNEIENELSRTRQLITPYGRKRTFFDAWGKDLFNEATAYVPQSTVADHAFGKVQQGVNKPGGLLGIAKWCSENRPCKLVHTAHDSVMLEVPKKNIFDIAPQIYQLFRRPLMINGIIFTIPSDGEYGERWGELKSLSKLELCA